MEKLDRTVYGIRMITSIMCFALGVLYLFAVLTSLDAVGFGWLSVSGFAIAFFFVVLGVWLIWGTHTWRSGKSERD